MTLKITPSVTTCNGVDVPSTAADVAAVLAAALGADWADVPQYLGSDVFAQGIDLNAPRTADLCAVAADGTLAHKLNAADYTSLIRAIVFTETWVTANQLKQSPLVPQAVALWQGRAALKRRSPALFDQIDAFVESHKASSPELWEAFNMGNTMSRTGLFVTTLAPQFGLSSADLDALFVDANSLTA